MEMLVFFQLKTERERVAERMIRLGKKWEAEHQQWEERERQNEAQMKVKEMELLASDKKCLGKLGNINGRVEKGPRKGEMNMDNFLKKERQLMLTRLKPKDKKFVPFTKDLRVVDAKFVHIHVSIHIGIELLLNAYIEIKPTTHIFIGHF